MIRVAFFSPALNVHQRPLADALYEQTQHQFVFVELEAPSQVNTKFSGESYASRPYLLQAWKDENSRQKAREIALTAQVALFGQGLEYQKLRVGKGLLSFEVGERWLKRGWLNLLSPALLKNLLCYHLLGWKRKPLYRLCASAFAAGDEYRLHAFKDRCYKWGYFIEMDAQLSFQERLLEGPVSIMWCARFLELKHPELPVLLAKKLKEAGYEFVIDMYGDGPALAPTRALCETLQLQDLVHFHGAVPNAQVIQAMRGHQLFLFTSDKHEGWGAVLSEAMCNGCAVVTSDACGAAPFLVKDGENGLLFKSGDIGSLYEKVALLMESPQEISRLGKAAWETMMATWSPRQAALNLLRLTEDLSAGRDTSITEGPCSKALPL